MHWTTGASKCTSQCYILMKPKSLIGIHVHVHAVREALVDNREMRRKLKTRNAWSINVKIYERCQEKSKQS